MKILIFDFIIFFRLLAVITNIVLGLYIYFKDTSNKLNKLFSLFALSIAIWSFGNFLPDFIFALNDYYLSAFQHMEIFSVANKFTTIGSVFQAAFLLHFIIVFTERDDLFKSKKLIFLFYTPAIFFVGIELISPIILNSPMWIFWYALVAYIILFTLISLLFCFKFRKKTKNNNIKRQTTLIIVALLIPFIGGIFFEFIPRIFSIPITSLTTSFTTIMALIIFYTIVKYNLMVPLKERLKATEEKYKNLFNTIPDSILLISDKGIIIEINDSAVKNWNQPKNDIVGKNIYSTAINNEDNERVKILKRAVSSIKIEECEHNYGNKYFQYIFVPTKTFEEANNILVIERDITEKKNAENKIKEANKIIKSANELLKEKVEEETKKISYLLEQKEQFIIQLSHDLRTPLGPILNLLKIIRSHEKEPEEKEMLDVIQKNADYIKNLVTKSIEIARLNSQNAENKLSKINIFSVINNYVFNKKYLLKTKGILIENNIQNDFIILYNDYEFEVLIANLIDNAINYNKENGKIIFNVRKENNLVQISIQDTGIGMTEKQIIHAFEEFYKADDSRHHLNSTGLGLSICKRIVEKHGGKIWIESEGLEKGTTVFFTVPHNS
jgi:PAS domain S-box-containing protein